MTQPMIGRVTHDQDGREACGRSVFKNLAAAVIKRSLNDARGKDPIAALDAAVFLASDHFSYWLALALDQDNPELLAEKGIIFLSRGGVDDER